MSSAEPPTEAGASQQQLAEALEVDSTNVEAALDSDTTTSNVADCNQENQSNNQPQPESNAAPATKAAERPSKGRRKREVMDVKTAKAILAEPFDEAAEADRPIPALFKESPDGSAAPLDGIVSLFLTSTTLDLVKCSRVAGQGVAHGVVAAVSKDVILGDIQFRGAISDFYAYKAAIVEGDLDELLLRVNADDVYGDGNNFELVVSKAAADVSGHVAAELERRRLRDERIARRQLAERSLPMSARDLKVTALPDSRA